MAQVDIYNVNREVVGKVDLAPWWDEAPNEPLVHQAVVSALAGMRRGTASTKNRSAVRGGGRKPFRQKGTGRARQGTIRAPQMRGGGVVFGPAPRDFSKSLNSRMNRKALQSALAFRAGTETLVILDEVALDTPKTKELVSVMDRLDVISALVVVENKVVHSHGPGSSVVEAQPRDFPRAVKRNEPAGAVRAARCQT